MTDTKVVLITGCSSGIGRHLALEFHKQNCRVFASARTISKLEDLREHGIDLVQLDVTNDASMEKAVDTVLAQAGRIDILVNNAGLSSYAPGIEVSLDEIRQLFETNFFGTIRLTQLVAQKYMIPSRTGTIVMISSIMGEIATPFASTYAASKAALTRFSDSLRMELAPFNIKVATIKPGGVKSDIAANAREKTEAFLSGDSVYKPIAAAIQKRSQASQEHPMPTELFAKQVVKQVLTKPPASMLIATNARLLWILNKILPYWLSDLIFSKKFGVSQLRKLLPQTSYNKKGKGNKVGPYS
eukprot:Phypoly_transcript_13122.p1 GENE.Phypoly_transcript_13122~~Phypoly_transcript_13122.p1  ORF type:complete len:300 (+),score=37.87 Phypoly_transcript_13122:139-1038(+)